MRTGYVWVRGMNVRFPISNFNDSEEITHEDGSVEKVDLRTPPLGVPWAYHKHTWVRCHYCDGKNQLKDRSCRGCGAPVSEATEEVRHAD